jgi:GNAT superfamily N-acetyltransferase
MQEILESTASPGLLPAMTSNMAAFWSPYGRAKGSTLYAAPEVVWFYTGVSIPILNGVLLARLQAAGVRKIIDNLQVKIDEQGAPALWWIAPDSEPENLGSLLEQNGLQYAGQVPGMAIDLATMERESRQIANFDVQKVKNRDAQALWAYTVSIGMGFPEKFAEAFVQLEIAVDDAQYKSQHRYIGFLDGVPVAASALVLDSGLAGIYAVATLPPARRKGIGAIMTIKPLVEAREIGYRVGILQSSQMGYSVYQKIGFREVCKYEQYLHSQRDDAT